MNDNKKHQGEPVAWLYGGLTYSTKPHSEAQPLYTHADPGEVERLHSKIESMRRKNNEYWHETESLRAQLAERDAQAAQHKLAMDAACAEIAERDALLRRIKGADAIYPDSPLMAAIDAALSASAEPSAPKCKGWTCFHCNEHFTDSESASIHFGSHEIQRPACLIDAEEYRSMEARVREFANEDSELHRQMHRQANEHKLELRRAEESGYAKALADARAPVEIDERAEFEKHYASMNDGFAPGFYEGEYDWHDAQPCWLTWQARAALERKP